MVIACAQPAWSFERIVPDEPSTVFSTGDQASASKGPAAAETDSCLAFLQPGSDNAAPAHADWQPPGEGQAAAALSFVFGVRFALGPKELTGAHRATVAVWQPGATGEAQAVAVAQYRHCRTESALKEWNR